MFQLGKNTAKWYTENDTLFKVNIKNNKYLVHKNFRQISFKPYYDIDLCDDPNFFVTQKMSEADVPLSGLVNSKEEPVIPNEYSGVKLNPSDSLIMLCGAGVRLNSEDHVFDYSGKKIQSYHHHIDLATKHFIVFKVFEPKEHFIIYNIETKEEKELIADEIKYHEHDNALIRIKNIWWVLNLKTGEKTELKK